MAADRQLELLWLSLTVNEQQGWPTLEHSKVLQSCSKHQGSAASYFAGLRSAVSHALQGTDGAAAVLETGIACLQQFLQLNLCGPVNCQHVALWQPDNEAAGNAAADGAAGTWGRQGQEHKLGQDSMSGDDRWAVSQLEVDGEDVVGRVQGLDLLLAALLCIAEPLGHFTTSSTQPQSTNAAAGAATAPASAAAAAAAAASAGAQQLQGLVLKAADLQQLQLDSWCWWCLRVVMLQQHVLSGRSNTLHKSLKQLSQDTLSWTAALPAAVAAGGSNGSSAQQQQQQTGTDAATKAQVLAAAAQLEVALVQQSLGRVTDAQQQLEAAAAALGVEVELKGALGVRTKHQLDPKAQLVAAVKLAAAGGSSGGSNGSSSSVAAMAAPALQGFDAAALGFEQVGLTKELEGMADDSAVYLAPRLVDTPGGAAAAAASPTVAATGGDGSSGTAAQGAATAAATEAASSSCNGHAETEAAAVGTEPAQQQQLSTPLQALLLGWAAQIRKGTSQDELQQWQMAPFVEAVLQQQHTHYMLHATARLLKCRHEKARGRTRERALMQLEQLCSALEAAQPGVAMRMPYVFAVRFPLWPLLRKELAEFYIAMGFVGAALKIFEALEMWDQLIVCYRLLDKKQAAQELVSERLKVAPEDAKLWCALGDITGSDEHYRKAWEVSGHRSSRAQRSLGRCALRQKDYGQAAAAFEAALSLNPLYSDVWFSLGYCYLRLEQTQKALQAFSQVTHQEPEHGEAWANLCALWLQQGAWREALHAAEQAVKLKRDSWQTWDNYALAASKADAPGACVRALGEVLVLTQGQRFPLQTAEALMDMLEQQQQQQGMNGTTPAAAATAPPPAEPGGSTNAATDAAAAGPGTPPTECEAVGADDLEPPPEELLQMLSMASGLGNKSSNTSSTGDAHAADGADAPTPAGAPAGTATAAALQRSHQQVMQQLGGVLKQAANSPACGAAVWGLLGRWYGLQGQLLSSQEARLKQVRALQSSPYKSDPEAFTAMADASEQLCRAYLASAAAGQGGIRELAAGRMHLRGLLKQCEAAFEERPEFKQLQELLAQVVAAEDAAVAAKKQAS